MSNTKRTTKLGFGQTWFFLLAFIPFIQWIPFFMMNGKLPKKRWVIMGFANILAIVASFFIICSASIYYANARPSEPKGRPDYPSGQPVLTDYLGDDYWKTYDGYDEYSVTPEYKQYKQAEEDFYASPEYIQYKADTEAFESTDEYQQYQKDSDHFYSTHSAIQAAGPIFFFMVWFLFLILCFFIERYKYIRALTVNQNRDMAYNRLNTRMDMGNPNAQAGAPTPIPQFIADAMPQQRINPQAAVININTATEEELMKLPGMKTIDAKKIIDYRNKNGNFNSIDEFFNSFEVKPHILVKMQNLITLGNDANVASPTSAPATPNRRFDF